MAPMPVTFAEFRVVIVVSRSLPVPAVAVFFFNDTASTEIYALSLHDALPIYTWLPAAETLPTAMSPAVVVLAVTLLPVPPALTVVRVSVPLSAARVIAPSVVVTLVTVRPPLFLMPMPPVPETFADVRVVIVVSKLMPVPAVAVKLDAVTLFVLFNASATAETSVLSLHEALPVSLPTAMSPAVVVVAVTLRPVPPALTVVRVSVPLSAARVIAPSVVVALVTVRAPLFLMPMAPVPGTLADVRVVIVVSRSMPVPAVAVRLEAVTLFAAPLASVIAPTAVRADLS